MWYSLVVFFHSPKVSTFALSVWIFCWDSYIMDVSNKTMMSLLFGDHGKVIDKEQSPFTNPWVLLCPRVEVTLELKVSL